MSDVTLELTFAEREVLNHAVTYWKSRLDSFDKELYGAAADSVAVKIARLKCGAPGCSYCDYNPDDYPEDWED